MFYSNIEYITIDNKKTNLFLTRKKQKNKYSKIKETELEKLLNHTNKIKIFCLGDEILNEVQKLHKSNKIHLGLRTKSITKHLLKSLPVIRFNNIEIYFTEDTKKYNDVFDFFLGKKKLYQDIEFPDIRVVTLDNYKKEDLFQFFNDEDKGIDFETYNFPIDTDYFPLGVSISSEKKAVYFAFEKKYELIKDHEFFKDFKYFLDKQYHKLWAYNCPFEINCLIRMYNKFYELQDTWAYIFSDGRAGSLKYNAQYYLGIKSWDDEVVNVQDYLRPYFSLYKSGKVFLSRFRNSKFYTGEYILDEKIEEITKGKETKKLKKQDRELLGKDLPEFLSDLSTFDPNWEDRLVNYWGNEWAIVPDQIMGYYCCLDSFMDIAILKKLKEKYSNICYKVHLYNLYLKACSDNTGQIRINWDLKDKIEEYYKTVKNNSELFCNLMLYRYQKNYFEKYVGEERIRSYNIPHGMLYSVYKYGSFFFLEDTPSKVVKNFLRLIVKNREIDLDILKHIVGKNNCYEFLFINDIYKNNLSFSKKIIMDIYSLLNSILNIENIIKIISDDYITLNKKQLLKRNEDIENNWWVNKNIKELESFVIKGVFDNKPKENDPFSKSKFKKSKIMEHLKLYYIDNPIVKYRLKNNFLPADYHKHIISFLTLDRKYKELKEILKKSTISSDLNNLSSFKLYNLTSAKLTLEYGKWFENLYKKRLMKALTFYELYLADCPEGFVEKKAIFNDFLEIEKELENNKEALEYDRSYSKFEGKWKITWRLSNTYKELTEKRLLFFCKCFSDKNPAYITKNSFLNEPDFELDDLFYFDFFDKIFRLFKSSIKVLTSPIKFINNNSYKRTKQPLGFTNGKQGRGEDFYLVPKLFPLATKTGRFKSPIHTIGGGDDGKLSMINDSNNETASYFDVSQAEVRMLLAMCKDPELEKLYKEGGDAYKKMALMAFPYLAQEGFEDQLKAKRNEFKSVFLSYIYGATPATIARNTGLPLETVLLIIEQLDSLFSVAVEWSKSMVFYTKNKGYRNTFFGEMSTLAYNENVYTSSVNHAVQGATTKILAAGYYNIQRYARQIELPIKFKYSIHDSCINVFEIKNLFFVTMLYRKFFRGFIKNTFGVDFKYDLDLLPVNHRDHTSFLYNHSTGEFKLKGFSHHVDKILKNIPYKFNVENEVLENYKEKDMVYDNTYNTTPRDHILFPLSNLSNNITKKEIVCKLQQPLKIKFIKQEDELFNDI